MCLCCNFLLLCCPSTLSFIKYCNRIDINIYFLLFLYACPSKCCRCLLYFFHCALKKGSIYELWKCLNAHNYFPFFVLYFMLDFTRHLFIYYVFLVYSKFLLIFNIPSKFLADEELCYVTKMKLTRNFLKVPKKSYNVMRHA